MGDLYVLLKHQLKVSGADIEASTKLFFLRKNFIRCTAFDVSLLKRAAKIELYF